MAEIEYEVREQDLVAFNEHQMGASEAWQKRFRRHQSVFPGMMAVVALVLWVVYQNTLAAIFVGVMAVAWGLLTPLFLKWSFRRQLRKLYSEEEKASVMGDYKLRTTHDALVEIHRDGESRIKWADILRIEATKKYAFVFVDVDMALIVPRATVKTGDLHEFIKEADKRIEQAS